MKDRRILGMRPWFIVLLIIVTAGLSQTSRFRHLVFSWNWTNNYAAYALPNDEYDTTLVRAAIERTAHDVRYDPAYVTISYPGGDVPDTMGVCTDVIIRSYRKIGIDLQKGVHEDMKLNFDAYPKIWGLKRPNTSIDHRRVPNLMTFFRREGAALPISDSSADYRPGDIVAWNLHAGILHIGIVTDRTNESGDRFLIAHNIGAGPELEDCLFDWKIIGHFRYPLKNKVPA